MFSSDLEKKFSDLAIAQAKTEAQMLKTEATLARMGIHLGGMSNNNGENTEDYFYNSLYENRRLGNLQFDEISRNLHGKIARFEDEFDIAMFNGTEVALIECKYKANESDLLKLIDKKVANFKLLFPYYANHNFYLGIASRSFYPQLEMQAKEKGVAILKEKGDIIEIDANNLTIY